MVCCDVGAAGPASATTVSVTIKITNPSVAALCFPDTSHGTDAAVTLKKTKKIQTTATEMRKRSTGPPSRHNRSALQPPHPRARSGWSEETQMLLRSWTSPWLTTTNKAWPAHVQETEVRWWWLRATVWRNRWIHCLQKIFNKTCLLCASVLASSLSLFIVIKKTSGIEFMNNVKLWSHQTFAWIKGMNRKKLSAAQRV